MSGREIPSHRKRRTRIVVKGTAALEPAPLTKKFNVKNTEKVSLYGKKDGRRKGEREGENDEKERRKRERERQDKPHRTQQEQKDRSANRQTVNSKCSYPETKNAVLKTLDFHFRPPITARTIRHFTHTVTVVSQVISLL